MHGVLLDRPNFATKRTRLLELLRTRAFQEREVTLSSGLKSNFYIDCKQVSFDAEGAALIGELAVGLVYGLILALLNEMLLFAGEIAGCNSAFLRSIYSIQRPRFRRHSWAISFS